MAFEIIKKYKFIQVRVENNEHFNNNPVYRVYPNKNPDKGQIGLLSFYKPWKEYVFSSMPECVFNNTCMRDIIDFIENEIPKHQKKSA